MEGCSQVRLSERSICVEGLARLWSQSCHGGCGCKRILCGYAKDIDAWYLHEGRDMSGVLVGRKAIIILPP